MSLSVALSLSLVSSSAAVACTDSMNEAEIAEGRTFPCVKRIREVAHQVACAVIDEALKVRVD